jgi:hypothetical protein
VVAVSAQTELELMSFEQHLQQSVHGDRILIVFARLAQFCSHLLIFMEQAQTIVASP